MSAVASRLYSGVVTHTRLRPLRHALRQRIPMLLVDLDEMEVLERRLKLFTRARFGVFSISPHHHLSGDGEPLKPQVQQRLAEAGIEAGGAVRLLCMPAVFGQVFNPLSLYFCHRPDGTLAAILYEVNNTFGGRHAYLMPVIGGIEPGGVVRQICAKSFHVSPFMDMNLTYQFEVSPPGDEVSLAIRVLDADGPLMNAGFTGHASPLTDVVLLRTLLAHPMLMLEVLGGIHWHALKLWLKGLRLRGPPRPFVKARGTSRYA